MLESGKTGKREDLRCSVGKPWKSAMHEAEMVHEQFEEQTNDLSSRIPGSQSSRASVGRAGP